MHGRGEQAVEEAELDVGGQRHARRQPGQQGALHDRPRHHEAEVGLDVGELPRRPCAALVPLAMTASSISGSTKVGMSSCARRNCTVSARRPSAGHDAALAGERRAQAGTHGLGVVGAGRRRGAFQRASP